MKRQTVVINAPSNLGLRPPEPGAEPGTWAAPGVLAQAGLPHAVSAHRTIDLPRPHYQPGPQNGTTLRNGFAIRKFNLELAGHVDSVIAMGQFPLVVGGDCSILLGALAGARRYGSLSLVHVDGHSDFRHPGNYDVTVGPGSAAGMDLALATGRGEPLLTDWPGVPSPLILDERAIQIGERELHDADYAWPDIARSQITLLDVFTVRELGIAAVLECVFAILDRQPGENFWFHLDIDVLDQTVMPAVDSPGGPGIDPDDLVALSRPLINDLRCAGLDLTIFDPELDTYGACAALIVSLLQDIFR